MLQVQPCPTAPPRAAWKRAIAPLCLLGLLVAIPAPAGPSATWGAVPQIHGVLPPESTSAPLAVAGLGPVHRALPGTRPADDASNGLAHVEPAIVPQTAEPEPSDGRRTPAEQAAGGIAGAAGDRAADAPLPPSQQAAPAPRSSDPARPVRKPDIFGSLAILAPSVPLAVLTRRAFAAAEDAGRSVDPCEPLEDDGCVGRVISSWADVIDGGRRRSGLEQVDWINRQVNQRLIYEPDTIAHSIADHWSPAHETMLRERGDCEDFAILKMRLLQLLGHDASEMFVVVVESPRLADQHAVLALRHGETFLVLDNLSSALREADEIDHYRPVFSVNSGGFWIHGFPAARQVAATGSWRSGAR